MTRRALRTGIRRPSFAVLGVATLLAATGAGVGGCAGATPSTVTATTTTIRTTCNPAVNLATWSLGRLAATTVAVPAQAGQVGALAPEVRTGYGGLLLFGTSAPASLPSTLARLQAMTPQHLGLLVMTDEEGGGVLRLENLVAPFPWPRTLATTQTPAQVQALARRVGTQLKAAGLNTDLAPVLDVDSRAVQPGPQDPDGLRSFGGSVSVVTTYGVAFARGLQQAGITAVVKHFPGLGGSTGDTDYGPAATRPWPTLRATGLRPFASAIDAGVPAVMVANARVPGLTPLPASISKVVLTGVLRTSLHFKGLIVTDSLTAGAFAAIHLSPQQAAVDAIAGGADLVLLGAQTTPAQDASLAVATANAIASAAAQGKIPRPTLAAAAAKVLAAHGVTACSA